MSVKKHHKWRKGEMPQLCTICGIIRSRKNFKTLMAITQSPPYYDHYKYRTKIVYTTVNGEVKNAGCKK